MCPRVLVSLVALSLALAWSPSARAQVPAAANDPYAGYGNEADFKQADTPPPQPRQEPRFATFGSPGQFVVTASSTAEISHSQYDNSQATSLNFDLSPGLDYFVVRNLSIGVTLDGSFADVKGYDTLGNVVETETTNVSGGLRLGLNVPLGGAWSFYPRLAIGPEYWQVNASVANPASNASSAPSPASTSGFGAFANLFTPILWHVAPHFFVGAGPRFITNVANVQGTNGNLGNVSRVEADVVVGGYWGGAPPVPSEPPPVPVLPAPHFGDADTVVFTGETGASLGYFGRTASGGSGWNGNLGLGADFFVTNHFSLGVGAQASSGSTTSLDGFGQPFTDSSTTLGGSVRIGGDIPLGGTLSLYPRGSIGLSHTSADNSSQGVDEKYQALTAWVGVFAPLLVHPSTHFFFGAGPWINRDISSTFTFTGGSSEQNPGTSYGVSFVVGGWL